MTLATWLDRVLYRHPFEGASARRYAQLEHPAFAGLENRILDAIDGQLRGARRLLEVGAGPAAFAARAAERYRDLSVIALEPSADFARPRGDIAFVRAAAESLPFADHSIDVAVLLSAIRHVRSREAALCELRRVVRGRAVIAELDPAASATRIAMHANRLRSRILRHAFGPLVVRTAPGAERIADLARAAGFTVDSLRDDPEQPVYIMELV